MTRIIDRTLPLLAAAGSAGLLLAAWGFQYIGGLAPCPLCIWQRWPHGVAVLAGLLFLRFPRVGALLGAGAMATGAGIALYHTGVERGWWQGPTTCTGAGDLGALSAQDLLDQIMAAPLIRCDEVAWSLLGLSMASWNGLASLALAGIWVWVLRDRISAA